ncbi:ABC transporter substrate-binding protein [Ensifer canadensis]
MAATAPAFAETPKDTLVEAFAIDDVISMDPGEAFELTAAEITGNTYSMLVRLDINDTTKIVGDLADSWTVSDDGLTYTFKLKSGLKFASGNPVTAADVAWSFERAVKLDKSPAFILTQFGLTGDNVTEKAKAADDTTFVFTVDQPYAPSFVLNCLTATVGAVLDKKLVLENVKPVTPNG